MYSKLTLKLPLVQFSSENLNPETCSWHTTCKSVRQALEEYGCFEAVYDKVSLQLHNEIFGLAKELFDLPSETKMKNTSEHPYFGYIGNRPLLPQHFEGLGIESANTLEGTQNFTNLMWPQGNVHFCETLMAYSKLVSELEQVVKKMVFESYGVEKYYESHKDSCTYLLRVMKYGTPEAINQSEIGSAIHTDKSFITILHQNEVNGLEVKTKDSDHWIGFNPSSSSSFIVMAGDAFLAWSNGRIHSAMHRVNMNIGSQTRYSVGLFSFNKGMIHVPQDLVDEQHLLRFKSFDHFGLLHYYATQQAIEDCTAQAYCGV